MRDIKVYSSWFFFLWFQFVELKIESGAHHVLARNEVEGLDVGGFRLLWWHTHTLCVSRIPPFFHCCRKSSMLSTLIVFFQQHKLKFLLYQCILISTLPLEMSIFAFSYIDGTKMCLQSQTRWSLHPFLAGVVILEMLCVSYNVAYVR